MKKRIHIPVNRSGEETRPAAPDDAPVERQARSARAAAQPQRSGPVFGLAVAVTVILALAVAAYYLVANDISLSLDQGISDAELSRQLDTVVSSARLLELSQRKANQDQVALKHAQERDDEVLIDTFRLSLEKSTQDQRAYQRVWAEALVVLHKEWQLRRQRIEAAFVNRLETLDEAQVGSREALQKSLSWIQSVPQESTPADYFTAQLSGGSNT